MNEEPKSVEGMKGKMVPIDWHYPEGLVTRYANNVVVQHNPSEFFILFFEIKPPLLLGPGAEEKLKMIAAVEAECVARIVVSPERIEELIEVLRANLETFKKTKASQEQPGLS